MTMLLVTLALLALTGWLAVRVVRGAPVYQLLLLGSLVAALPIVLALFAGGLAEVLGCTLNEGGADTCLVAGMDISGLLYTLFMLGWLAMLTLPVSALLLLGAAIAFVVHLRRQRSAPPPLN